MKYSYQHALVNNARFGVLASIGRATSFIFAAATSISTLS
jgi:hypothetical protein